MANIFSKKSNQFILKEVQTLTDLFVGAKEILCKSYHVQL